MQKKSFTKRMIILFTVVLMTSVNTNAQTAQSTRWDFNTLDGWVYEHQDDAPTCQCSVVAGSLYIYTRANSRDRQKMKTADKIYTTGRYSWRTYISEIAPGEQTSIGSWIYSDDHHELDFEVGPGNSEIRAKYGIKEEEMVACMTSQDYPFASGYTPILPGWHDFCIELQDVRGKYMVKWYIDGEERQRQQLRYGPEVQFRIYCSVENLTFIGDFIPTHKNYAKFDYVEYINEEDLASIATLHDEAPSDGTIYNLQGMRVDNPRNGQIYIINNKKVKF